jgi:hypothetical protein
MNTENKSSGFFKNTTFGEFGKREIEVIKLKLMNYRDLIDSMIRKANIIADNWNEFDISELLEDWLWEICIIFQNCSACVATDFCKRGDIWLSTKKP